MRISGDQDGLKIDGSTHPSSEAASHHSWGRELCSNALHTQFQSSKSIQNFKLKQNKAKKKIVEQNIAKPKQRNKTESSGLIFWKPILLWQKKKNTFWSPCTKRWAQSSLEALLIHHRLWRTLQNCYRDQPWTLTSVTLPASHFDGLSVGRGNQEANGGHCGLVPSGTDHSPFGSLSVVFQHTLIIAADRDLWR